MLSGVNWCNHGDLKGDAPHFYQHDLLSLAIFQIIFLYYFTIILTHCLRVGEITLKSVSLCARDPTHFLPVKPFAWFREFRNKNLFKYLETTFTCYINIVLLDTVKSN